jgi:hypothetical protein
VLSWKECDTSDIDFSRDHVFAHLIHPDSRHTSGVVQAIDKYHLNDYVDHPLLKALLPVAVFDLHSYPLVVSLGEDWCFQIDWIPLDLPNRTHSGNYLTQKLLAHYNIDINLDQYPKMFVSNSFKQRLKNKIVELKKENPHHGTLSSWYERDMLLYNRVTSHIQDHETSWPAISWLSHYNP